MKKVEKLWNRIRRYKMIGLNNVLQKKQQIKKFTKVARVWRGNGRNDKIHQ